MPKIKKEELLYDYEGNELKTHDLVIARAVDTYWMVLPKDELNHQIRDGHMPETLKNPLKTKSNKDYYLRLLNGEDEMEIDDWLIGWLKIRKVGQWV